jgi:hypothetical protein
MVSGRPIREQSETAVKPGKMPGTLIAQTRVIPLVPLCEGVLGTEDPGNPSRTGRPRHLDGPGR